MMYRRDNRNKSLDDFGEAKARMSLKAKRQERAGIPLSVPPAMAAASAMK